VSPVFALPLSSTLQNKLWRKMSHTSYYLIIGELVNNLRRTQKLGNSSHLSRTFRFRSAMQSLKHSAIRSSTGCGLHTRLPVRVHTYRGESHPQTYNSPIWHVFQTRAPLSSCCKGVGQNSYRRDCFLPARFVLNPKDGKVSKIYQTLRHHILIKYNNISHMFQCRCFLRSC
jgi:hypothetical protein